MRSLRISLSPNDYPSKELIFPKQVWTVPEPNCAMNLKHTASCHCDDDMELLLQRSREWSQATHWDTQRMRQARHTGDGQLAGKEQLRRTRRRRKMVSLKRWNNREKERGLAVTFACLPCRVPGQPVDAAYDHNQGLGDSLLAHASSISILWTEHVTNSRVMGKK